MYLSEAFILYERVLIQKGMCNKTIRNYRSACASFLKALADIPIQLLTIDDIQRWKMYRDSIGAAPSTIAHDLSRLKHVLRHLRKMGMNVMDEDFIELPKVPQKQYTWLEYKEVQTLLDVIERPRDKAIVACLFATGCRISELLNLNREDIKGNTAQVIGKGDQIGTVYFDDKALSYLKEYLNSRSDNLRPLFISGQLRRIKPSTVAKLLHEYADMAGINKNVTPHVFRHSFATDMKLNGADIFDIKELLRHKRISSTQIYTHIAEDKKQGLYDKYHSK